MVYSCNQIATVGVKGFETALRYLYDGELHFLLLLQLSLNIQQFTVVEEHASVAVGATYEAIAFLQRRDVALTANQHIALRPSDGHVSQFRNSQQHTTNNTTLKSKLKIIQVRRKNEKQESQAVAECNGSGELVIGVADCNIRSIITT